MISTNNSLTIREPVQIELSIQKDTMIFLGIVTAAVLVGVKAIRG